MIDAHMDILRKGVEEWNLWRLTNHNIRPDLTGAVLKNMDLTDCDLSFVDMDLITFHCVNLSKARFYYSTTDNAHFEKSQLLEALFLDASLDNTVFDKCDLTKAVFKQSNLTSTLFFECSLCQTDFSHTYVSEAKFNRNKMAGAIFINSY